MCLEHLKTPGSLTPPPPPPPPAAPTSEPLGLCVDDISDTSVALKWRPPERMGSVDLEGYGVEYCKEGSKVTAVSAPPFGNLGPANHACSPSQRMSGRPPSRV